MNTDFADYSQTEGDDDGEDEKIKSFSVALDQDGERLDKVLSSLLPEVSRSRLKALIEEGAVRVNGNVAEKPKQKMNFGDAVEIIVRERIEDKDYVATEMELDVVYEDDDILVINKPADLVVHPAAGHWDDTLLNGLLAYDPVFAKLPRAGIVHRLDKDTTGLMVVAKNEAAQLNLVRQLQDRTVKREYWAITRGNAPEDKIIEAPIQRDPRNPLKFTVGAGGRAREALTHIRCIDRKLIAGKPFSWVACRLKTGRTHQIRVHMESVGLPLIGDPLYRNKLPRPKEDGSVLHSMNRQALHASRLGLLHPQSGELMEWFAEPPEDFRALMDELGFGPWDAPSEVFGDPVVMTDAKDFEPPSDSIGRVSSWSDFDFGDEDGDDEGWVITRTNE